MVEEHGAVVIRTARALLGPADDDADDAWFEPSTSCGRRPAPRAPAGDLPERTSFDAARVAGRSDLWHAVGALPFKQRAAVPTTTWPGCPMPKSGP